MQASICMENNINGDIEIVARIGVVYLHGK